MSSSKWTLNLYSSQLRCSRSALSAVNLVHPNITRIVQCRYHSIQEEPEKPLKLDKLHKFIAKSRLLTKLSKKPRFRAYFDKLSQTNPVSTITSFLILHEITAIVPLFTLWWALYTLNLDDQYDLPVYFKDLLDRCGDSIEKLVGDHCQGFDRNRLVLSGAVSYAIVKVLYPARVLVSLWAAPFFFKWLLNPFQRLARTFKRKNTGKPPSSSK
ncbi:LANO_0E10088g1_1 [Lachancea nothofagi CBS 11611]|uniref:LANO_0E10088g1_1 n=1 Tax=Lachancea nothofagi CBS 11611 TaxID=1266666 RepID=A0A1G4JWB2_9SACH|nr:LANO_0E10088g1_1 [Lachancea nothofagi CBS 11611]